MNWNPNEQEQRRTRQRWWNEIGYPLLVIAIVLGLLVLIGVWRS